MNLTVIIPVFNEERTIGLILKKVLSQKVSEVIIIDDGSRDKTPQILSKLSLNYPKLKVIKHQLNMGKGTAIKTGIKHSSGEIILIQDADLEYNPKDYPALLKPILQKKAQFVFGTRWHNKRGYFLAQIGNLYLNKLINTLYSSHFKDPYTGSKIGTRESWKKLNLTSKGFEIEAEIACKIALKKIIYFEIPISYKPRSYSEGKKIGVKDIFLGTKEILKWRI